MGTTEVWTIGIATYAAVIATGALALEVRRWRESGPRLVLSASPEMSVASDPPEPNTYLVVTASNTGDTPTTITHFALFKYDNIFQRWRDKKSLQRLVLNPSFPGDPVNIPKLLRPGERWMGVAGYDNKGELANLIATGKLYAAIIASHKSRATVTRITVPRTIENSNKTES